MIDDLPEDKTGSNVAEFSVSEISGALKRTVEDRFGHVRVRGEISGYRGPHSSGHAYFALKDERARLEAVIWRGVMGKLKVRPEEGMEVVVTGKLTTYPGSSKYQIVIEALEPAGIGALMAVLEERRQKLAAEGLFEDARKQLLPFMPQVIGVVTSPTGAVIRDILHRISERFPLHILVWPVAVQGEDSGRQVAQAVRGFNQLKAKGAIARPDIIIVARGGGSLEDLWSFNDEAVVRAVSDSDIPVISAVGHETDWTLIDYAADIRAPTPTGAAEKAVPVKIELEAHIANLAARLHTALARTLDNKRQSMRALARAMPSQDQLLGLVRRRFDEASNRLQRAVLFTLTQKRNRFDVYSRQITPYRLTKLVADYRHDFVQLAKRLSNGFVLRIEREKSSYQKLAQRLNPNSLTRKTSEMRRQLDALYMRQQRSFIQDISLKRQNLETMSRVLKSLSYNNILQRGFALVVDGDKKLVKSREQAESRPHMTLRFYDGEVQVTTATQKTVHKSTDSKKPKPGQGELF